MSSKLKAHGSTKTETTSTQAGKGEISAGNSAREEENRGRVYEIYVEGGEKPGRELDDWLQAQHALGHRLGLGAQAGEEGGRRGVPAAWSAQSVRARCAMSRFPG